MSAALGGFLFGYDTAVINGAVGAIGDVFAVSSIPNRQGYYVYL